MKSVKELETATGKLTDTALQSINPIDLSTSHFQFSELGENKFLLF